MKVTCDRRAGNENATGKVTCDGDSRRECLFDGKATGMVSCDRDSHFVTGMVSCDRDSHFVTGIVSCDRDSHL